MLLERRAMMERHTKIPAEYQEVEYIESTSAHDHIDVAYTILSTSGVIVKAMKTGGTVVQGGHLISSQVNNSGLWLVIRPSGNFFVRNFGTEKTVVYDETAVPRIYELTETNDIKIDAVNFGSIVDGTGATGMLRLFDFAQSTRDYTFYGRLYFLKIITDGETEREFVPCFRKADNKIGVYDTKAMVFYESSGSFVKGASI